MPPKRIALLGSPKKPEAAAAIAELRPWFEARAQVIGSEPGGHYAEACPHDGADLIVSFGGDGTLLGLARQLAGRRVPVMGVNFGKLGYMAEFSVEEMKAAFDDALAGRLPVVPRAMLEVAVESPGTGTDAPAFRSPALNDVWVNAGSQGKMVSLSICINGRLVTEVSGDGLIVSTPSGSTAYNLAAGGPIVLPGVAALVVTPICPHTLTHRPIVIPDDSRIEIRSDRPGELCQVNIDGQVTWPLQHVDTVRIGRAGYDFLLIDNPARNRFETLRDKLHWGVGPI